MTGQLYWSTTDYPYECLIDYQRTEMLRTAIRSVVRPGDTVLDAGAGTGILSLFAAECGAGRVLAVEVDELLARNLRETVRRNGLDSVIEVIHADILECRLPSSDVVLIEMIETGLMEESLVGVLNGLVSTNVITPATTILPGAYITSIQLLFESSNYYGFDMSVVKHEWPHYSDPKYWNDAESHAMSDWIDVWSHKFGTTPIASEVKFEFSLGLAMDTEINAVRVGGKADFGVVPWAGAFPSMNAPKIIPLQPMRLGGEVRFHGGYTLGGGLSSFWLSTG